MYTTDFEYNKKRLSEFGMILCTFNGGFGVEAVSSGADLTLNQAKPSGYDRFSLYSAAYDAPYTATFQICKNPCTYPPEELYLSPQEVSKVQMWLCRNDYHKFKINQDGYRNIYWNAAFTSKQLNLNGRIVGLEVTMYTDSPYAYYDEVTHHFSFTTQHTDYFFNLSDKEGYLYPDLEIKILQGGNLSIILSNRTTLIKNCSQGETITINGNNQIISSSVRGHEQIAKDFNFVFPRITRTYQETKNTITADLNCEITLTYSPIVLIGL